MVHKTAVSFLVAGAAVITLSGLANQDAGAGRPREPGAADAGSSIVDCTEASLVAAVAKANANDGGLITFDCHDVTIPVRSWMGRLQNRVVVDGENRNITLAFTADFSGCLPGDNGIKGRPIARLQGEFNVIRNLTLRHFLESVQVAGPNNLIESNRFLGHLCSDDAVSTVARMALNTVVRKNYFENYRDKAFQFNYGSGVIEENVFVDTAQPFRAAYDNSGGGPIHIRKNVFRSSDQQNRCNGPHINGRALVYFDDNRLECRRGLRVGGHTEIVVRRNSFLANGRVGLEIRGNAVVSMSENVLVGNGLSPGSSPAGGVVILESARADLGGGALPIGGATVVSRGGNRIQGNGAFDVRNSTGTPVSATRNCWDHSSPADVRALDTEGAVEVEPLGPCSHEPNHQ
ncbi:MAG TPA: hypothetical protein VH701_15625 [Vicinamibacterales bacterium]